VQGHDALFASEIKKYDTLVADIDRNIAAQTELLARVDKDNKVGGVGGWE
jgi:programmed cell death 6-interacting protein